MCLFMTRSENEKWAKNGPPWKLGSLQPQVAKLHGDRFCFPGATVTSIGPLCSLLKKPVTQPVPIGVPDTGAPGQRSVSKAGEEVTFGGSLTPSCWAAFRALVERGQAAGSSLCGPLDSVLP